LISKGTTTSDILVLLALTTLLFAKATAIITRRARTTISRKIVRIFVAHSKAITRHTFSVYWADTALRTRTKIT